MTQGSAPKDEPSATQDPNSETPHTVHRRTSSSGTERPTSAQLSHDSTNEQKDGMVSEEQDDEDSDPADKIADFDWDDLLKRYHDAINQCSAEEAQLMEEWTSLMNYFRIWADSGHTHESDRTFKRLVTRSLFVQNEEDKLEKTRDHYVNVVKAFESALNLLKAHGFGA